MKRYDISHRKIHASYSNLIMFQYWLGVVGVITGMNNMISNETCLQVIYIGSALIQEMEVFFVGSRIWYETTMKPTIIALTDEQVLPDNKI